MFILLLLYIALRSLLLAHQTFPTHLILLSSSNIKLLKQTVFKFINIHSYCPKKIIFRQIYIELNNMRNTVQQLYDDKITLMKTLQTTRMQLEKLERENKQLLNLHEQSQKRLSSLRGQYMELQRKHQFSLSESTKTSNSFSAQIEQMKNLVEEKQRQIQNIQLRMIPNIDQDMVRVKLITEMEGPYQQMVDKKQKEIDKLKNRLSETERKNTLLELNLTNKSRQYQKQTQSIRCFYKSENQSLMKQITHFMAKNEVKNIDKDLVKTQRKQIDQLRYTLEFKGKQIEDLHCQIAEIKTDRDKLLSQLAEIRSRNVLEIQKLNISNPQALKSQNNRLASQLQAKRQELERCQKRLRQFEVQLRKLQSNYGRETTNLKQKHLEQKEQLKNQIRQIKSQYDRTQNTKNYQEHEHMQYTNRIKILQKQNKELRRESEHLREKVIGLEHHNKQVTKFHEKQVHIIQKQRDRQRERQNISIINNEVNNRQDHNANQNNQQIQSLKCKNQELQIKISRLLKKLEFANRKIVELIKEKAASKSPGRKKGYSFHDTRQSPQRELIQLQFQDAGFVPLCPPAYYHEFRNI